MTSDWPSPAPPEDPPPFSSPYGPPSTAPGYAPGADPTGAGAPADWWRRVLAIVLDGLILSVPYTIVSVLLGLKTIEVDPVTNDVSLHMGAIAAMSLISLIISCVYSGILEGGPHGATVGKMALRIRVGDAATGEPLGFGRAAVRRFVYQILFLPFGLPGLINGLSPLWDPRRQAWHDKAVGSLVVNAPRT
jgi:uncharacterized RDD family membrane protein YckC